MFKFNAKHHLSAAPAKPPIGSKENPFIPTPFKFEDFKPVYPVAEKPTVREKFSRLESILDNAVGFFYPDAGKKRVQARTQFEFEKVRHEKMREHRFNYEGARPGNWRSQATLVGNASSETPTINYDRIRLIWESRDLEQNFPFIQKLETVMEDYTLGDFRMKSKATSQDDRGKIEDYWKLATSFLDPQGVETFHDQSRLALRSAVRDGDCLGVFDLNTFSVGDTDMEFYQVTIIEADCIGYPYEASYGNGYLNGVLYDVDTGFREGYRVYRRDPVSNSYLDPQDIPSNKCVYIGNTKRAGGLRNPSEFAPAIPTMRDIQEIIENERLAEKWLTSQAGVVTRVTGDQAADTDIYTDPYQGGSPWPAQRMESAKPGALTYLSPGEEFKAFEFNRFPPAFQGLLETLYRDCCMALSLPFGFVYKPTENGVAARLESAQAKRTFQRWQRIMRDKWLMPIWNRVMLHGIESGQLQISPQGQSEITKVKIIWPAHPSVDVGRESTANVNEFNVNLKAGESIAEERGDDYDEMMDQKKYEQQKERASIGLAESVVNNLGPRGIDGLLTMYTQISSGAIPPENARQMLVTVFGLSEEEALKAIPEGFKVAQPITTTTSVKPPTIPSTAASPG